MINQFWNYGDLFAFLFWSFVGFCIFYYNWRKREDKEL